VQGNLSFRVPGLEAAAEGSFIMVNETAVDKKTKEDFEKVIARLQEDRSELDLSGAIQRIATTI
jgi:hypothetical protein